MSSLEDFDLLVLGNEPAGIWALAKLAKQRLPNGKESRPLKLGLLSGPRSTPVFFPSMFAEEFGILSADVWSSEVVTPKESFLWREADLVERFPKLTLSEFPLKTHQLFSKRWMQFAKQAILNEPELLFLAKGISQVFTRSMTLTPEVALLSSLSCLEVFEWDPLLSLPESVFRFSLSDFPTGIHRVSQTANGKLCLQLQDQVTLRTDRLLLNCSYGDLKSILDLSPEIKKMFYLDLNCLGNKQLFRIPVRAKEKALPGVLKPMTFYFETLEIPDLDQELFPFQFKKEKGGAHLELWLRSRGDGAIEALLDRYQQALKRLFWLFPFLNENLDSLTFPLGIESCSTEEYRSQMLISMSGYSHEIYSLMAGTIETRSKRIHALPANLYCYYPNPVGPLIGARDYIRELVKKDRLIREDFSHTAKTTML